VETRELQNNWCKKKTKDTRDELYGPIRSSTGTLRTAGNSGIIMHRQPEHLQTLERIKLLKLSWTKIPRLPKTFFEMFLNTHLNTATGCQRNEAMEVSCIRQHSSGTYSKWRSPIENRIDTRKRRRLSWCIMAKTFRFKIYPKNNNQHAL
jgi:hypothetical protein